MKKWLLLAGAVLAEVAGTLSLRGAVDHPAWTAVAVSGYVIAFTLLGLTLRAGIPVGVAYGIWGACGVALVALLGVILFSEVLSLTAILGIVVIIIGVVLVQTGVRNENARREVEP